MKCLMIVLNYRDVIRAIKLAEQCSEYGSVDRIVIVDNCSDDGSYEKLKTISNPKIDVLEAERNGGFASGNNIGAKYAISSYNPEFIFFANTDTEFPEENILKCIKALEEDTNLGLVSTRMVGPDGIEQGGYFSIPTYREYIRDFFYIGRKIQYNKRHYNDDFDSSVVSVGAVRGSFMFFRTQALIDASLFDENTFMYCEESIISMRLRRAGYQVGLCTDCFYIHNHVESNSNPTSTAQKRLYESRIYFMKQYLDIGTFRINALKVLAKLSLFELQIVFLIKNTIQKK